MAEGTAGTSQHAEGSNIAQAAEGGIVIFDVNITTSLMIMRAISQFRNREWFEARMKSGPNPEFVMLLYESWQAAEQREMICAQRLEKVEKALNQKDGDLRVLEEKLRSFLKRRWIPLGLQFAANILVGFGVNLATPQTGAADPRDLSMGYIFIGAAAFLQIVAFCSTFLERE